ncbi:uncharacterized protein [Anabrus simplex]|uniref:uncharacterized protein n=1 Tax=Anabrus simplex TaxID=316456 RepID=UPI0035A353A1
MLQRCCTATLLLLVVSCVQCLNDWIKPLCHIHTDEDDKRYTTRVTLVTYAQGFTSHTVNAEGTVVSRVNVTFADFTFNHYREQDQEQITSWITRSPFEKDFWLGVWPITVSRLSVHVYNMSLKQIYVSSMEGSLLEELELSGNSWPTTSGLSLNLKNLKKLILSDNQIEELHEGLLHGCPYLEVFDLSRNKIKRFDDVLNISPFRDRIKELNLSKNFITDINPFFWMY